MAKGLQVKNRRLGQSITGIPIEIGRVPLIGKDSKIFTMGSCFALELRNRMIADGHDVLDSGIYGKGGLLRYLIWYNTFTILYEFQRAAGTFRQEDDDVWQLAGGGFQDPYRITIFGKDKGDLLGKIKTVDACMGRCVKEADCIVITLGLTEVWFQNGNGRAIYATPGHPRGKGGGWDSHFRFTGYDENYGNMRQVIQILSELNPKCGVVVTTSPVPLARTFMDTDQLIANTESKSILRAVAGALSREFPQVHYFHAYELAMNVERELAFGRDGMHVRPEYATHIVEEFKRFFFKAEQ